MQSCIYLAIVLYVTLISISNIHSKMYTCSHVYNNLAIIMYVTLISLFIYAQRCTHVCSHVRTLAIVMSVTVVALYDRLTFDEV